MIDVMMDIGPREIRELSRSEMLGEIERMTNEDADGHAMLNYIRLFANKAYEAGRNSVPNILTWPAPK